MSTPVVTVMDYNAAAVTSLTVEAGQPVILGLGHRTYLNLNNGSYKWTASGVTIVDGIYTHRTYYLEAIGGGDPGITWGSNGRAYQHGWCCDEGSSTTALTPLQWKLGDSNSLGFTTLYVCVPGVTFGAGTAATVDPDSLGTWGMAWAKDNTAFSWGSGDHATAQEISWTTPDGTKIFGWVCAFDAVSSGTITARVVNAAGEEGTLAIPLTVTASTRTAKYATAAGSDTTGDGSVGNPYRTLDKIVATHGSSSNIEARLEGGASGITLTARTITGSNWRICTSGGTGAATVAQSGTLTLSGVENFSWVGVNITSTTGSNESLFDCTGSTAADPSTRHLFKDIEYSGAAIDTIFGYDRFGAAHAAINVRPGSLPSGLEGYFIYDVNRADFSLDGRPFKLLLLSNCANAYGSRDESAARCGGDLASMVDCSFEQTNITEGSAYRTKTAGMRIVGGDWWYFGGNTFSIPQDTSAISNVGQAFGGISIAAPTATSGYWNGSWSCKGTIIERNRFQGTAINWGGGSEWGLSETGTCFEDTIIRRNVFDWGYQKHAVPQIGVIATIATTARIVNPRILHNTFYSVTANLHRPIELHQMPAGRISGLRVENNIAVNPNATLRNNDYTSIFMTIRSDDLGVTQIASFNGNVGFDPDESSAGGGWPAGAFIRFYDITTGNPDENAVSAATVNGYAYSTVDNSREDVILDGSFRITGSPAAKTSMVTKSSGVARDYRDKTFAPADAVGAVCNPTTTPKSITLRAGSSLYRFGYTENT